MKTLLIITILSLFSCDSRYALTREQLKEACERSYFEGQKDAMNGDYRIKKTQDSCYVWIKSPWDNSHEEPIYTPSICK